MNNSAGRKHTGQNEKEFIELEKALRTLCNEGFLNKIECRIIASIRKLDARKVALYDKLTSKYKQNPMDVLQMFKILTSGTQEEPDANTELSNFDVNEEMNENPLNTFGKNPLLINTVIHNVFTFLPLNEIKKCRLVNYVNHQWNTTAEPFLRKRGLIHFQPLTLTPLDFIHAQEFSLPDLPFTEFKFWRQIWCPSEIQQFFDEWGHNIKSVEFRGTLLGTDDYHDITSWITTAKNLNKLIISYYSYYPLQGHSECSDGLGIALDALAEVESISLDQCTIFFSGEGKIDCLMAPREIHLLGAGFAKEGQLINNICFNDYIDFSRSLKIDLSYCGLSRNENKFDMSRVVLNAKSVSFYGITVENWGGARGKVDCLFLSNVHLIERINLEIKELTLRSGTIDMSVIPLTIEKLRFSYNTEIICDYSLQIPSLKFLGLTEVTQSNLDMISRFACCTNLKEVELEVRAFIPSLNLNVGNIPKSVKKLKLRNVKINTSGLHKRQLDTLIIEQTSFENFFDDFTKLLTEKILTLNVLVISCLDVTNLKIFDFIRFVKSNMEKDKSIGKLVVGVLGNVGLNKNRKFKGSVLSRYVDKESNYYQFSNKVGQSITAEEFEGFTNIDH